MKTENTDKNLISLLIRFNEFNNKDIVQTIEKLYYKSNTLCSRFMVAIYIYPLC